MPRFVFWRRSEMSLRDFSFFVFLLVLPSAAFATVFGSVRGIVHDPQHRPVPGAQIVLKAKASDYSMTAQTDANGEFQFEAVPLGQYAVTATGTSLAAQEQDVTVLSGTAPVLHFELRVASQNQ